MGHNGVNPRRKVYNSIYIVKWERVKIKNNDRPNGLGKPRTNTIQ